MLSMDQAILKHLIYISLFQKPNADIFSTPASLGQELNSHQLQAPTSLPIAIIHCIAQVNDIVHHRPPGTFTHPHVQIIQALSNLIFLLRNISHNFSLDILRIFFAQAFVKKQSPLHYFGFILYPFHTMEYVSVCSFLIARSINFKARTHFEQR